MSVGSKVTGSAVAGSAAGVRVRVAPDRPEAVVAALTAVGATVVDAPGADLLVWTSSRPAGVEHELTATTRAVQLPAAGVEAWVAAGVLDDGRTWCSAAGAYGEHVAERAVAGLLAVVHGFVRYARRRTWTRLDYRPLSERQVLVLGGGGIGCAVGRRLVALGAHVTVATRDGSARPGLPRAVALTPSFDAWGDFDDVVVALPATPGTVGLVNERVLRALPADGGLVNVGRGEVVDTAALVAVLADGHLSGAVLDVVDPEPLPDGHPLWSEPAALVTGHSANPVSLRWPALGRRAAENAVRLAEGRELLGVVDVARGY